LAAALGAAECVAVGCFELEPGVEVGCAAALALLASALDWPVAGLVSLA
jgi:hypothetical protein